MDVVKIQITEDEWFDFPKEKRDRIKQLMKEQYGEETAKVFDMIDVEEDVYGQFYGDEE